MLMQLHGELQRLVGNKEEPETLKLDNVQKLNEANVITTGKKFSKGKKRTTNFRTG